MSKERDDVRRPLTAREIVLAAFEDPLLRGVPCLLGPSGGGKTFLAQAIHRERHPDGVLVTIIPAQESGDELGGLPLRPTKARQTVEWTLPTAVPQQLLDKGGTIFIDEMDKAAPDVWPVLLRLLAERMLRSTTLPPSVDIIAAANELETPLPDPLVARLMWLRFPEQADGSFASVQALQSVPGAVLSRIENKQIAAVNETKYPAIPASRRAAHRLASWTNWPGFWEVDDRGRQRILSGILPQELVPETLKVYAESTRVITSDLALRLVQELSPASLEASWLDLFFGVPPDQPLRLLQALEQRADADVTGELKPLVERAFDIKIVGRLGGTPEQLAEARKLWQRQTTKDAKAAAKDLRAV